MDFDKKVLEVAEGLIGRALLIGGIPYRIVETEAYEGGHQTQRRECMLRAPGEIGIMPFRGHEFVNIGTEAKNTPSCVLLRAVEGGGKLSDGPGKVGRQIGGIQLEGMLVGTDIPLQGDSFPSRFYAPMDRSKNSLRRYRDVRYV